MKIVKLAEVVKELESGARPKGGVSCETGTIPSIGAEHLSEDGGLKLYKNKFITTEFFKALKSGKIKRNDILIVKDGATTGKVSFVGYDFPFADAAINEHVFRVAIDQKVSFPKYVYFFLKSLNGKKQILNDFRGATVGGISRQFIELAQIPLPPLDDQLRIATILTCAERLIAKRKDSIKALDELLKSTFGEMFGDPVRNERGWEIVTLKDLCSKVVDCPHNTPQYSDEPTGLYCIRSSDIQNGYLDFNTTLQVDASTFTERNERHIPSYNDIVFTREGGRLGNSARVPRNVNICLGQRIMLFEVNCDIAVSEFFWALLNTVSIQQCIQNLAGGGAAPRINIKDLIKIKCYCPPLKIQSQFAAIAEKVESLKVSYTQSLKELENLYGSLSQRAFKGELDLSKVPLEQEHHTIEVSDEGTAEEIIMTKVPASKTYSDAELMEVIRKIPGGKFTFALLMDEIKKADFDEMPEYEKIKTSLYRMLDEENPKLSQVFDEEDKQIVLRVNP